MLLRLSVEASWFGPSSLLGVVLNSISWISWFNSCPLPRTLLDYQLTHYGSILVSCLYERCLNLILKLKNYGSALLSLCCIRGFNSYKNKIWTFEFDSILSYYLIHNESIFHSFFRSIFQDNISCNFFFFFKYIYKGY